MPGKISIANAPCSWGALEFDLQGQSAGYKQVLDEMKTAGYAGTELGDWGFMPTDPQSLKKELEERSLQLLGAFVPVALSHEAAHKEGVERALKTALLMKDAGFANAFIVLADDNGSVPNRTLNAGRIKAADALTREAMEVFAKGANTVAEALLKETGMRTVFHHHCAGYIETPEEIEALLTLTNPACLGLCFDTGHFMYGGGTNPAAFLEKHYDRIWHVHFKDFSQELANEARQKKQDYFASVAAGIFCELGKGEVDFAAVRDVLVQKAYNGWIVVEQDVLPGMGNPFQCAVNNRNFLASIDL